MQHVLSSWVVCLTVVAVSLTLVRVSVPVRPPSLQVFYSSRTLQSDQQDSSDWLFTRPSSPLQEFGLQGERQSKQVHLLACSALCVVPHTRPHNKRFWSLLVQGLFPVRRFFPRKLSSPSSADDPFVRPLPVLLARRAELG
jgi:hypothetical protein